MVTRCVDDVYDIYRAEESSNHSSPLPTRTRVVVCGGFNDIDSRNAYESEGDGSSRQTRQSEAMSTVRRSSDALFTSQHQPMEQTGFDYASTPEENYVFNEYGERDGYEDDDEGEADERKLAR